MNAELELKNPLRNVSIHQVSDTSLFRYERSWYNPLIIIPIAVILAGPVFLSIGYVFSKLTLANFLILDLGIPLTWYVLVNLIFKQPGKIFITNKTVIAGGTIIPKSAIEGLYIKEAKDFFTGGSPSTRRYFFYMPLGGDRVTQMGNALAATLAFTAYGLSEAVEKIGTSMWFKMNDHYVSANYQVGITIKGKDVKLCGGVNARTAESIYEALYKLL